MMDPQPGEVFYDLGCGTGLPSAVAAIMFPQLARSEGVEYLEVISEMGQQAIEQCVKTCAEQNVSLAPLSIKQGDVLTTDWSHADILLCNNVTWNDELLSAVAQLAANLKPNTRFISLHEMPAEASQPHMELRKCISIQMSWGS